MVFLRSPVQQEPTDRWHWPLVALFVAANALAKSIDVGYSSYFLDEAVHVWFAQMSVPELVAQARNDPNPPLYNLLIAGWIRVFGVSEVATRAFSVVCVSLAAGALFHFLRRHFGLWVGLFSAVVWTCTAYPVHVAHLARPYGLLVLLTISAYGLLLHALRHGGPWRVAAYAVCCGAMLYAHPTSVFNLPVHLVLALVMPAKDRAQRLWVGAGLLAGAALFGIYYLTTPYYANGSAEWIAPPDMPTFWRVARLLVTLHDVPMQHLLDIGPLLLAVGGIICLFKWNEGQWRPYVLGMLWAVVPIVANALFSIWVSPLFQEKYTLSTQIGLCVWAGAALAALPTVPFRMFATAGLCYIVSSFINTKVTTGEDWRTTAAHVRQETDDSTCTIIYPWFQFRSFSFYFDREAYQKPDSTYGKLIDQLVYTVLHDVLRADSEVPRYNRCHLIAAYAPDSHGAEAMRHLGRFATRCDTLRAEAITTYTYHLDVHRPLTRLSFVDRDGSGYEEGRSVERIQPEREYSSTIEFKVDEVRATEGMYEADVLLKGVPDLNGVNLVLSYFRDGQHLQSSHVQIQDAGNATADWTKANATVPYDSALHHGSTLRVFVWNPSKRTVWIDEMGLIGSPVE